MVKYFQNWKSCFTRGHLLQRFLIICIIFPLLPFHAVADETVRIGVLAIHGGDVALKTWAPLSKYLKDSLPGYNFQIVPLHLSEMHDVVSSHAVDFILTNSGNYVDLERQFNISPLATMKKEYKGIDISSFGAVIFTRKNENIHSLNDLTNKSFMGVKPGAFGGFQMAWRELKKNNIDPFTEMKELRFSGFPQAGVVLAVRDGLVDAGTVRTGILEQMADKGQIKLDNFRVLQRKKDKKFPYLLSTSLYPEWPFARLADTDQELAGKVHTALLNMPASIIRLGRVRVTGWSEPDNYEVIHDLMRDLQVGHYKNVKPFSAALLLKKYMWWIIFVVSLVLTMAVFLLYVIFFNRRVSNAKDELERQIQKKVLLEHSLHLERNFLKALLNSITDGVVACDNDGRVTLFNKAAIRVGDLGEVAIDGSHWQDYFTFFDSEGSRPLTYEENPFLRVLENNFLDPQELILKLETGQRSVVVSGQAIINEKGNSIGAVLSLHDTTERILKDQRLRQSEEELRAILDNMQDTYYRTNLDGKIIRLSRSIGNMLGYEFEDVIGKELTSYYVDPEGRKEFLEALRASGGSLQNYQSLIRHADGREVWVSTSAQYHYDDSGKVDGVEGVTRDITRIKNAQAELFEEKERAHITLRSIGDGVITTDTQGRIIYINPYAEQMLGCSGESAINNSLSTYLCFSDATTNVTIEDPVERCISEEEVVVFSEHINAIRYDGARFAVKLTTSPMRDQDSNIKGVVMVLHDISDMWKLTQKLSYQASHDSLTGLINRREFDHQLGLALDKSKKTGSNHTLCYMDLDQFKVVNDTCGHVAGDRLLKQLAQLLVTDIRSNDVLARLGGDEFGLLLYGCRMDRADSILEKIRKAIKEFRFSWDEKTFELGVSIGVVPVTRNSISVTELLSEADAACYVAKDLGRDRIHKYQQGDTDLVKHKSEMQWVHRIQQALDEGRFVSYYQLIQPVQNGVVWYSEILVRMLDENGDIVLPGAFIPAAERYHLMSNIDQWVINDVFAMIQDRPVKNMSYTINLSGQSVGDKKMLNYILESMKKYNIDPSIICFEITETAAVANFDSARIFIDQLHEAGCKFALDDFGSGLSSFAYLKNLDVDLLKIDGSFIRDIAQDPVDYAMVSSINRIGHLMGIKTIAEVVEDKDILERLEKIGVDYVQGFYIDRPRPLSDADEEVAV